MHKDDQMTPKERMAAFVNGEPMDRYPVMPFVGTVSAKIAGMTQRESRQSAENMALTQIAAYERFGHDAVSLSYGLHTMGAALGSKLNDPERAVPAVIDHVLKDLNDLDSLDWSRVELKNDKTLQMKCQALEILIEKLGDECSIGAGITGPLSAAASIYRIDDMLRAMVRNPEQVHKLLRQCTDMMKSVAQAYIDLGAGVSIADPVASGTIIKNSQYKEFVKPYTIELIEFLHDKGKSVSYHICGQTINIVKDMMETHADILSLDNVVDLKKAKELVGDHVCIAGNVDPVGVMMIGTPADVMEAVLINYRDMYDSPKGYLLASGCDIPDAVPAENIDAFMQAARQYGKYPLDPSLFS